MLWRRAGLSAIAGLSCCLLVMNAKNAPFQCEKLRESKTAIVQIQSTHVCSALWRIRVDIMT